jgi:phenylacetic acid degradation protein
MIFAFEDFIPVVHPGAFVHPQATVIGQVVLGDKVYVGPGAVLRGDWGGIFVEEGCNIQENCVVHMFPGVAVHLRKGAHIGHGAVIHGAEIGENVLVGMNAVVMDRVKVGAHSIIGALAFVPADMEIPPKSLVVGNPAKIIKEVSDRMVAWKTQGTALYQALPAQCKAGLREVEPLRAPPAQWPNRQVDYETWNETQSGK